MQGTPWQTAVPFHVACNLMISDQLEEHSMLHETKMLMVQDMTASGKIQYISGG